MNTMQVKLKKKPTIIIETAWRFYRALHLNCHRYNNVLFLILSKLLINFTWLWFMGVISIRVVQL